MWKTYFQPATLAEALALLAQHGAAARVVAGGTDLVVELQRGLRPTATLIDITRIAELRYVTHAGGLLRVGALATHNDIVASATCVAHALPLAQACWEVGAPQIRTRATVAGNLVTGSPANDTITPLIALDAELLLVSAAGERAVALRDFYLGVRRTVLQPGELLREIRIPTPEPGRRGIFLKLGLRQAQAISVVNVAVTLVMGGEWQTADGGRQTEGGGPQALDAGRAADDAPTVHEASTVRDVRIALGCVAPTIVRASEAEHYLRGRSLDAVACAEAGRLAALGVTPIDDLRGSAGYRRAAVAALVSDALARLAAGQERAGWPARPVLLETVDGGRWIVDGEQATVDGSVVEEGATTVHCPPSTVQTVETTVNGQPHTLSAQKTLLDALREDAGLTGTKEGCGEGECGACTVWLNGAAVMSCLVPAAQAHGAELTTIEGLAATVGDSGLHPLQEAFIAHGAVQCGYCIPGMLMAGAKLLAEQAQPDRQAVRSALSGNICRCTGYQKIFAAVEAAAE